MSNTFVFSLQYDETGMVQATLSDGSHKATVDGSEFQSPLQKLVSAVESLLRGASEAGCAWLGEPAEHWWLLSRKGEQLHIHIRLFRYSRGHMDYAGETIPPYFPIDEGELVTQMECDLLKFAKRLSHQVGQINFKSRVSAGENIEDIHDVAPEASLGGLREAISAYEHMKRKIG